MIQPYTIAEPIVQVKDVSLRFGEAEILRNVNTSIHNIICPGRTQGQVIGFLGPSGRGKTQLSKILAGLQRPTTGEVLVNDPGVPVKAGIVGYVTQNYFLRRNRNVLGNLLLAGTMHGQSTKEAKLKAEEYLALFELSSSANKYPAQLSGGQRQRIAIAQQLMCSDHYLIMDEPFSGLDEIMKDKVCDLIIKVSLMHELNTIIVISHDIPTVMKVSDTVWLLGQDRDANGELIPGSYIKKTYNLMDRGLCWDPQISENPLFTALWKEVRAEFRNL